MKYNYGSKRQQLAFHSLVIILRHTLVTLTSPILSQLIYPHCTNISFRFVMGLKIDTTLTCSNLFMCIIAGYEVII